MHNDSIETLLLRHFGSTASAPSELEATLAATVRHEARTIERQTRNADMWNERPISRRRVLRLVAFGSAGRPAYS